MLDDRTVNRATEISVLVCDSPSPVPDLIVHVLADMCELQLSRKLT